MRVFWKRMAALATGLFLLFNGEAAVRSAAAEDPKGEVFKPELIKEEGTFFPKTEDEETPGEKKLSVEDYMERRRHRYPMDWNCWPYVPAVTQAPSSPNTGVATSEVVPVTAEVVQPEANIRERANSTAGLLLRLGPGEQVTVLGQTTGADHRVWYRVRCENGTVGYVRYDRVDVICGTAQFGGSTEPTGRCIGQTNTRAVNVRLQMSKESGRIRLLRKGQSVTVIGRARDAFSTEWYYVRIPTGPLGYIQGSFLTVISGTVADAWRKTAETGTGYNGAVGNAGYTDYSGYTGAAGNAGYTDYSGYTGAAGNTGYTDYSGYTGAAGNTGYTGYSGYTGAAGTGGTAGYAGWPGSDTGLYPNGAALQTPAPQNIYTPGTVYAPQVTPAPGAASGSRSQEEVLYLRYILEHLTELNAEGSGYKGYSLQDFDGDGVQELLVNCGVETGYGWRIFTCEGGTQVVDLGRIEGYGYYAARPGGGVLVLRWGEAGARYALIRKAGGALIQVCELEKNADAAGNAVWNLDRKLIAEDTLRALLADFPEDVLLNLGITPGTAGTLDPAAFGLEPRPITTDPGWPTTYPVSPETQQTDPSQPGPDDIVNG